MSPMPNSFYQPCTAPDCGKLVLNKSVPVRCKEHRLRKCRRNGCEKRIDQPARYCHRHKHATREYGFMRGQVQYELG